MVTSWASWALGKADALYYGTRLLGPARPLFFTGGWGDVEGTRAASDRVLASLTARKPPWGDEAPEIEWGAPSLVSDGVMQRSATFRSPEALLPEEARTVHFEFVAPEACMRRMTGVPGANGAVVEPAGVAVLLPATGEQILGPRLHVARQLARDEELCSIVLVAPFYGARRPAEQSLHYIARVDHFLLQSVAILQEAALLSLWALETFTRAPVCVSGFSWGAAMCSGSALLASQWRPKDAHRIGCSPYVGSASPAVIVSGMLNGDICYDALVDKDKGETAEACRQRLLSLLLETHLEKFAACVCADSSGPRLGCIEAVSCRDDHFVPAEWARELFTLLEGCCRASRARQEWIAGGHVTAFLRRGAQVSAGVPAR